MASCRRARGAPIIVDDGGAVVTAAEHTAAAAPGRTSSHDVVILGGGLAGLTLALQLHDAFPDLDIVVLERGTHPLPTAAHKVGESTVDVGAHYFGEVLGLRDHLLREQILKFGLRYFFSDGRSDIDQVTELGVSEVFPAPRKFTAASISAKGPACAGSISARATSSTTCAAVVRTANTSSMRAGWSMPRVVLVWCAAAST